jgi:hypothetical protein
MAQDTTIGATLQSPLSVRKWKISNHYILALVVVVASKRG